MASPKIDGVRALNVEGQLVSRTMKAIPNQHTQLLLRSGTLHGLDGELVVGQPTDKNLMQQTMSGVMTYEGVPDVKWYIFDMWDSPQSWLTRGTLAKEIVTEQGRAEIIWVPHRYVRSVEEMLTYEAELLEQGYEGIMLRDLYGPYKQGRSTLRQGWLLKVKRFVDAEAIVLGYTELMHNQNELTTDVRGYAKRTSHQENQVAGGMLGALVGRDIKTGVVFDTGTGFTPEQRRNLWIGRKYLPGKIFTYKHFPHGVKDKPRHPVFKSFRDRRDM